MTAEQKQNSWKSEFDQQQEQQIDMVKMEAQRLVNLYRQLDTFGADFMSNLDQELLSISPEIERALSDILGGTEVRKYCDFLKKKNNIQSDDVEEVTPKETGYLPTPDMDEPISNNLQNAPANSDQMATLLKTLMTTHQAELEKLLSAQASSLSQLVQNANQSTHEMANHQTDRLIHAIKQGSESHYSDVIESATTQTPVLVPDEMEGF